MIAPPPLAYTVLEVLFRAAYERMDAAQREIVALVQRTPNIIDAGQRLNRALEAWRFDLANAPSVSPRQLAAFNAAAAQVTKFNADVQSFVDVYRRAARNMTTLGVPRSIIPAWLLQQGDYRNISAQSGLSALPVVPLLIAAGVVLGVAALGAGVALYAVHRSAESDATRLQAVIDGRLPDSPGPGTTFANWAGLALLAGVGVLGFGYFKRGR